MPLPQTRVRLKGWLTLNTVPGGLFGADAATIANNLSELVVVGSAQHMLIEQTRETNDVRREFNPDNLGRPVETYPGLPNYSVTLKRVDLYDINLMEAFGFNGVDIVEQYAPIALVAEQVVPVDAAGNPLSVGGSVMKARTYIIAGGWLENYPIEFNITDADQSFEQEVKLTVQSIHVTS